MMFVLDGPNENEVLTISVSQQLTKDDYQQLLPKLEALFAQYRSLKFFIELKDFHGFEIGALWEDLKFDLKHKNQYGKAAIVAETKWEEWGTKISDLIFASEMKFFPREQCEQAWHWVNS
jgi:hypothetical protein